MNCYSTNDIKKSISICIFIFVNFLFAVRYLSRVSDLYLILASAVSGIYIVIIFQQHRLVKYHKYLRKFNLFLLLVFIAISLFLFKFYNVNTLDVDRWSVISSFWHEFFEGRYPYFAKSNVGNQPGPMPFYFILALPFYLLGELGYFSIMGVISFFLLLRYEKIPVNMRFLAIILILGSVFHMWEIVCRSNIFLNGTIVLFVILQIVKTSSYTHMRLLYLGILTGLVLSTRNVFVIPFIIAIIYLLKSGRIDLMKVTVLGFYSILSFTLTFVPFVIGYLPEFLVMNPFIVQSSFLIPFHYTLFFIILGFIAGFYSQTAEDVYLYSGIILFVSIVIYIMYYVINWGIEKAFFSALADISYLILGLPFLLFYYLQSATKAQGQNRISSN